MRSCISPDGDLGRLVGDPVDVVTGANLDVQLDFKLSGPLPLEWRRHYDSSQNRRLGALGWGHTHEYDRRLVFDVDGARYVRPVGQEVGFPPLMDDGAEFARDGVLLRRVKARVYQVWERGLPTFEFEFRDCWSAGLLVRAFRGEDAIRFRYSLAGFLEGITDSLGRTIRVGHDDKGRISSLDLVGPTPGKDRRLLSCLYDEAGNLIEGIDPYRHPFRFRYDGANRMVGKTDRRGYSFHYEYDREGRCIRSAGEDGLHEVRLRYLPPERVTVVTKADGGQWTYFYDPNKHLTQVIDPYGGVTRFRIDNEGRVAEEVGPTGYVTRYLYDDAGALLGKLLASGKTDSGPRNPFSHPVASVPLAWEYGNLPFFGARGLPQAGSPILRQVPAFARDAIRVAPSPPEATSPVGQRDAGRWGPMPPDDPRVYDDLGVLLKERGPDGTLRRWVRDANGNVIRYHDRDGMTYRREYTSWNLCSRAIDPFGNAITQRFTRTERTAAVIDPGGATTEYKYDRKDRLVRIRRHGVVKEEYRYDAADRLIEKRDGAGNLLLSLQIGPGNVPAVRKLASGETQSFEYDQGGRYVRAATDDLDVVFAYDYLGKVVRDERDGRGVTLQFDDGRLTEVCVLGRFCTRYERRADDRVVIRDPAGGEHQIGLPGHRLVVRSLSNGSCEVSQFGAEGRCLGKVTSLRRSTRLWRRAYWYSAEGDLQRAEDNLWGTTRYAYEAHRLVEAVLPGGQREAFAYDAAGNLLRQPGLADVALREGNRLSSANGDRFEYNLRNHVAVRQGVAGTTRYFYDSADRLTRCETGRGEWEACYDPLGRRVSKSFGGQPTEYFWYLDRLEAELRPDGSLRIYVYADDLALVPLLFVEYGSVEADPASGRRYFVYTDQIGTPLLVESDAGEVVWGAQIDPYGTAHVDPASRIDMHLRFPGHSFDAETGLHYNRHRYYSPELGRYLQSDPLGLAGGLNLYAYTPSPLARVDLMGLECPGDRGRSHMDDEDTAVESVHHLEDYNAVEATHYAPIELGYLPGHLMDPEGFRWFRHEEMNRGDTKIHVSVFPAHAHLVAETVLPTLRDMNVPHKVVETVDDYKQAFTPTHEKDNIQGKFVTIYPRNPEEHDAVVQALDPKLARIGVPTGPTPTTRSSGNMEPETPEGTSGFLFSRRRDPNDRND